MGRSHRRGTTLSSVDIPLPGAGADSSSRPAWQVFGADHRWFSWAPRVTSAGEITTLQADAGLSRKVTLSWFTPQAGGSDVQAKVGVLWEHRVYQSVAHAVVHYRIERALDALELELPQGLRPRTVSLVDDVQSPVVPRVNSWTLQPRGGLQRLSIKLQRPISGEVYLVLELPWDGSQGTETVPLAGLALSGDSLTGGFAAYLADGVAAQPVTKLPTLAAERLDFARAWLPSLGTLPSTAVMPLPPLSKPPPQVRLSPRSKLPAELHERQEFVVSDSDVARRYVVEGESRAVLPPYLSGTVESGMVVSEVQGAGPS